MMMVKEGGKREGIYINFEEKGKGMESIGKNTKWNTYVHGMENGNGILTQMGRKMREIGRKNKGISRGIWVREGGGTGLILWGGGEGGGEGKKFKKFLEAYTPLIDVN